MPRGVSNNHPKEFDVVIRPSVKVYKPMSKEEFELKIPVTNDRMKSYLAAKDTNQDGRYDWKDVQDPSVINRDL